jgi:hypothetical protein
MSTSDNSQPETESMLQTLSAFNVGLGVISFALFPFLLPGLAILALFALPLLPLIPLVLVGWFLASRRAARRRAGRGGSRSQSQLPSHRPGARRPAPSPGR